MTWGLLLLFLLQRPIVASHFQSSPGAPAASIAVVDSVEVEGFGEHRSGLAVRFGDTTTDYDVMAMTTLPGVSTTIQVAGATIDEPTAQAFEPTRSDAEPRYRVHASTGSLVQVGPDRWQWTAPASSGLVPIEVVDDRTQERATLNVFVMVPYTRLSHGRLNGYRIGDYPQPRAGHQEAYRRPDGFIEVTPELEDAMVSPHFRLGQFVCKQAGGYPKYVVIRPALLAKLELLLAEANDQGVEASTFRIMSAYRTPYYNRAIGNTTTFSRHHYGDAADVFVDENMDGVMDDLNHDGRHTAADAQVLGSIVEAMAQQESLAALDGGLGTYGASRSHGPFVHVDVRGFDARWTG